MIERDKFWLTHVCKPLLPLAEKYYERSGPLVERGWTSFLPVLNSMYEYSVDENEIAEFKRFQIDFCKGNMGMAAHDFTYISNLRMKSREAYKASGNVLDNCLTSYERTVLKMAMENRDRHDAIRSSILSEVEKERAREMARNLKGYYKDYDPEAIPDRMRLYRHILSQQTAAPGFEPDEGLSTPSTPVFAREFYDVWKLGFIIEGEGLRKRQIQRDIPCWGNVDFYVGLIHKTDRGVKPENIRKLSCMFRMDWMFPVRNLKFGSVYGTFHSLAEFELCMLAYLDMYSIIQREFEAGLLEGLNAAKARGVI